LILRSKGLRWAIAGSCLSPSNWNSAFLPVIAVQDAALLEPKTASSIRCIFTAGPSSSGPRWRNPSPEGCYLADTVNVGPGQRYDVIWTARRPGKWLVHCHIPHHTTNNNTEQQGGGGLILIIEAKLNY
jgi:FtsP/CotA-like multicopper oxidase with cupredoxin domain